MTRVVAPRGNLLRVLGLAAPFFLATGGCDGSAPDPAPELPEGYDREEAAQDLAGALEAAGFEVDRGEMVFFRVEDCEGLTSCYGNNPSSPYGLFRVPAAPGEELASPPGPLSNDVGNTTFRLREDEALLFLGPTPPSARYFSFVSYVAQRDGVQVFGSTGDPINHVTIRTSGPDDDPFEREAAVVLTADAGLAGELGDRLAEAGLAAIVNDAPLPSDLVRPGLDTQSDVFTVLFRVALFDDGAAGEAFMASPGAALLRIRPSEPRAITPFAFEGYRSRGTGTNEDALAEGLDRLAEAIAGGFPGSAVKQEKLFELGLAGDACIEEVTECNGDNPDTLYWALLPRAVGPGEKIVVFGVDHRAAGKATYTNASVYDYGSLRGSVAAHDGELAGSAAHYLGEGDPDADSLFAWTFARDCGGEPFCSEVPEAFPGVALEDPMTVVVRAYLETATATAPDPGEVLAPRAVSVSLPTP